MREDTGKPHSPDHDSECRSTLSNNLVPIDLGSACNIGLSLLRSAYLWFGSYSRHMLAINPAHVLIQSDKGKA